MSIVLKKLKAPFLCNGLSNRNKISYGDVKADFEHNCHFKFSVFQKSKKAYSHYLNYIFAL